MSTLLLLEQAHFNAIVIAHKSLPDYLLWILHQRMVTMNCMVFLEDATFH